MAEIKLTKTELRVQQTRLGQLGKYLPTLQLKKAMLQHEVNHARQEIVQLEEKFHAETSAAEEYSVLLSDEKALSPLTLVVVKKVLKRYENIAGVDVPYFEGVEFEDFQYSLFESPVWLDSVVMGLQELKVAQVKIDVAREKKAALERELREVSIRVNLFERVLIPRAKKNIKKIKVFLGDQELAAVSQAKVAKEKIIEKALLNASGVL